MWPLVVVTVAVVALAALTGGITVAACSVLIPIVLTRGFFGPSPIKFYNFFMPNFITSQAPMMVPK